MKRLFKNFSALAGGALAARAVNYLSIIYLTRVLSVETFGVISFAQAFFSYFQLAVNFGLDIIGVREMSRHPKNMDALVSNVFAVKSALAAISLILIPIIVFLFIPQNDTRLVILIFSADLIFLACNFDWIFQALEKMKSLAFLKTCRASLFLFFIIWFVKNNQSFYFVPIGYIFGEIFCLIISVMILSRTHILRPIFELDTCKYLLKESTPVFLTFFMAAIYYNMDVLLLGFYRDNHTVGIYSAAYKIVLLGIIPINLWLQASLPSLSRRIFDYALFRTFIGINCLIGMFVSVLIFIGARFIIVNIYGKPFIEAVDILLWLSIVPFMSSFAGSFANILTPWGRQKLQLYATAAGALCNIFFNFTLIPEFGMKGAAIATVLAELSVGLAALYFNGLLYFEHKKHYGNTR